MSNVEKYEKEKFLQGFESLRPDLFLPESYTDEEKEKVAELVRPQRTKTSMFSSIPMTCETYKCVFADTCPLMKENLAPAGKPCPIEMSIVSQFTSDYMHQLEVKKELHLAVELEDKLHKRRKDLRNQLLATREAKAKMGQTQLDTAQAISDILDKVQGIEKERQKLIKQKTGQIDVDEYIEIDPAKDHTDEII